VVLLRCSLGLGPKRGPRKLGNTESGICPGISWNLHTRNLGIWNLRRSILESAHQETRNLEIGVPPRTHRGALETRKLGIWNLQRSILESAHLETWNLVFGVPLRTHGGAPETRKLGNWNLMSIPWRICTLGNMESGIWFPCCKVAPPPLALWMTAHPSRALPALVDRGSTAFRKWTSHDSTCSSKLGILKSFAFAFKMPSGTEIRSTKNDHLRHYYATISRSCPRSPSRTSTRKERKDTLDTGA
jgi:hypothetical protein